MLMRTGDARISAKAMVTVARYLICQQDYSDCLALLEVQPREILDSTCLVEDVSLLLLKEIRLRCRHNSELDKEIGSLEPRMMGLIMSAIRAKSLDVPFDGSMGKYWSLVDYASRARERDEVMLDDPGFWPWLAGGYPNISEFLLSDLSLVTRSNVLIHVLSRHFRSREWPHSAAYMTAVDCLCREVLAICGRRARDYAKKAAASWISAKTEMTVLSAIGRHFRIMRIDPRISGGKKRADMSFEHGGAEHYVEVYSHSGHYSAVPQTKMDIDPAKEWTSRFAKSQIRGLRDARVPSVYVMNLDGFQAMRGETGSREFLEEACETMPGDSDIVVILHGEVEAASLRRGHIVRPSDLALCLKDAIRGAMPENVPSVRP